MKKKQQKPLAAKNKSYPYKKQCLLSQCITRHTPGRETVFISLGHVSDGAKEQSYTGRPFSTYLRTS